MALKISGAEGQKFHLSSFSTNKQLSRLYTWQEFRKKNFQKYSTLTKRELEILNLIVRDFNNPQIARQLCISRATVEQHRKHIKKKLNISGIFELYRFALAFDLV